MTLEEAWVATVMPSGIMKFKINKEKMILEATHSCPNSKGTAFSYITIMGAYILAMTRDLSE